MQVFKVTLGLGRLANHHIKTINIEANTESEAIMTAKIKYYQIVKEEIGDRAPILNKTLSVASVETI